MNRLILKIFFALLLLALPCLADGNCPDENTIAELADKSKNCFLSFLSETLYQRLSLEYNDGRLSDRHKTELGETAQKCTETLEQILAEQLECKKQIEDYTTDDWEVRFGSNGLWNRLKTDILNSQMRLLATSRFSAISKNEYFKIDQNQAEQDAYNNDFETDVKFAFAQLKAGSDEHLKKTIAKWPAGRELLGKLALEKLSLLDDYSKITVTEAELAAETAIKNNPEKYADILLKLTNTEQLPVVFYAAGLAVEKDKPLKAIELFTDAGKDKETTFANDAAQRAAALAYNLFNEKNLDCSKTARVFENYLSQTNADDDNILYCYGFVLKNCDRKTDSVKVFEQITERKGSLALQAEYEIILLKLESEQNYPAATEELYEFLQKIQSDKDELYDRALETYCKVLLNRGGRENAQKVSEILSDKNMPILKARAHWMLEEKQQTISELTKAETLTAEDANFCATVLEDIKANLDELVETCGKNLLKDCIHLAARLNASEILILELQIVETDGNCPQALKTQIEQLREQIDPKNRDFLRLYARFNTKIGDYKKACELWSELVPAQSRNPDFWPAKYYQLLCLSKISEKDSQKAGHAAEVLLNSEKDIPQFWRKKLLNLTNQIP